MALINCPQCGHMISDKAKACPKCGYVLNNEQAKPVENIDDEESESQFDDCTPQQGGGLKWILIVLAILVIGGGVGYYFYADNKAKKEIALAAEQARLDSIEAARLDSLRQDSLRRDSIEFYKFTSPDLIAFDLKGHVKEMKRVGNLMPRIIPIDGFTSVTFSYNGEVQFSAESWMRNASRNGNGFLTQGHDKNSSCYVEWNGNNIIRQSYEYGRYHKKFSIPTYKDGRIVAYKSTTKRYDILIESDATIEYQDFDNYGNWISCVIKQTSRYPNGTFDRNYNRVPKEPTLEIDTLKREITYYTRTNYSDEEKEIKQRNAEFQKREEQRRQQGEIVKISTADGYNTLGGWRKSPHRYVPHGKVWIFKDSKIHGSYWECFVGITNNGNYIESSKHNLPTGEYFAYKGGSCVQIALDAATYENTIAEVTFIEKDEEYY